MIHKDALQRIVRDALALRHFGHEHVHPYVCHGLSRFQLTQLIIDDFCQFDWIIRERFASGRFLFPGV